MRIKVNDGDDINIDLRFPSGLAFNRFFAYLLYPKAAEQYGVTITREQSVALVNAIKEYKRAHPDWKIVEVENANGTIVEIKL